MGSAHRGRVIRQNGCPAIGEDILPLQRARAQPEHVLGRGADVLDHDVEVQLLRDRRVRPRGRPVCGCELERQPGGPVSAATTMKSSLV